jgi:hypothetical protein
MSTNEWSKEGHIKSHDHSWSHLAYVVVICAQAWEVHFRIRKGSERILSKIFCEAFARLDCDAAYIFSWLPTFRDIIPVPSSTVQKSDPWRWELKAVQKCRKPATHQRCGTFQKNEDLSFRAADEWSCALFCLFGRMPEQYFDVGHTCKFTANTPSVSICRAHLAKFWNFAVEI